MRAWPASLHHPLSPHPLHTTCREVKLSTSVTDYFHEDGYLAEPKFRHTVSKLLSQYERLDASSAPRPKALNPKKRA